MHLPKKMSEKVLKKLIFLRYYTTQKIAAVKFYDRNLCFCHPSYVPRKIGNPSESIII